MLVNLHIEFRKARTDYACSHCDERITAKSEYMNVTRRDNNGFYRPALKLCDNCAKMFRRIIGGAKK